MLKSDELNSVAPNVAILLCAGYGTRMGGDTPKPLLEVSGRPVLDYLLDQIEALPSLETVHVVTNSRHAADYRQWADGHRPKRAVELVLHDDGSTCNDNRQGAIGDLAFVLDRIPRPAGALVAAGDNILRFALEPFWRSYLGAACSTVLALRETDPLRLHKTAALELEGRRVRRLLEKPEPGEWAMSESTAWACPACYALDVGALDSVMTYLADGGSRDEIGRFIGHLVATREVRGFRLSGQRLHVGNRAELQHANTILSSEEALISDGREEN